jgi:hypothetical protein
MVAFRRQEQMQRLKKFFTRNRSSGDLQQSHGTAADAAAQKPVDSRAR